MDVTGPEDLLDTLTGVYQDFSTQNPRTTIAILLFSSFYPELPFKVAYALFVRTPLALLRVPLYLLKIPFYLLRGTIGLLGFGRAGVQHDSYASRYQSSVYGGYTPKDSSFASYQSHGARGTQPVQEKNLFYTMLSWGYVLEAFRVYWNS
ncbi:hypothetical protein BDZ94DRAFT_1270561 [Collybia nuda]|uniref:Uncharacterized protein n=1 Tax=Collybia nuda TaxID=64659 RepID=A0A9P5XXN8_9AGAR|nr:hypothetical protein BDZ94DRAFT_1270561 [Collybia nuda]